MDDGALELVPVSGYLAPGDPVIVRLRGALHAASIIEPCVGVLSSPSYVVRLDSDRNDWLIKEENLFRDMSRTPELPSASKSADTHSAPNADRGRRAGRPEEDVQARCLTALETAGFLVLQTSVRAFIVDCPACKHRFRPVRGTGQTPGIPDLFARHPGWPELAWRGIEVKGPKTAIRPAQRALLNAGAITIVRSPEAAVEAASRPWATNPVTDPYSQGETK